MKKEIKKEELQKEVQKTELEEAFVLWRNEAKSGGSYLRGYTPEKVLGGVGLVGYFNSKKRNPKEPDIRVYTLDSEGKQDKEVCSLWENVSKAGNQYLTGTTDDKEKIIGFYENYDKESNRPYIKAYFKQE